MQVGCDNLVGRAEGSPHTNFLAGTPFRHLPVSSVKLNRFRKDPLMRMRTIFGALLVLTFLVGTAMAGNIPVSGEKSSLQLANESRDGLDFHVEVGQIQTQDIATKGGNFTRLIIPGFHTSKIEGQPELPMMNRLIAIPVGATAQVSVRNVKTRMINLADFGVTNAVFPAQPSVSKSADLANLPFIYDAVSYQKAEVRPEIASVVYQGRLRAMDFGDPRKVPSWLRPVVPRDAIHRLVKWFRSGEKLS